MANDSTAHRNDWIRFYKASQPDYKAHALSAVLRNDGIKMLHSVLRELKLEKSVDLVSDWVAQGTGTGASADALLSTGKDTSTDERG